MRKGFNNEIYKNEAGEFSGINLGSDFTSEHEWGIKDTQKAFGIDGELRKNNIALKRTTITKIPTGYSGLAFSKNTKGDKAILVFSSGLHYIEGELTLDKLLESFERGLSGSGDAMSTAWSDGDFGIVVRTSEQAEMLSDLYQAFLVKDVSIWVGGSGPFKNGGLQIAINSKIDPENISVMEESDLDQLALIKASDKTGIIKRLKAKQATAPDRTWEKPCGYYACSPSWMPESGNLKKESKHPVHYFLNPQQQKENNHGWYTVEELDQWIKGKGPIPMEKK